MTVRDVLSVVVAAGMLNLVLVRCDCGQKAGGDDGGPGSSEDAGTPDGGESDAGTAIDAGLPDGSAPVDGGGLPDGAFLDGGICTLRANGAACAIDTECCSNRCDPTLLVCVTGAGVCFGLGERCTANSQCCAGRTCAPDPGGVRRCTDETYCAADGKPCTRADQCCSLRCGACVAAPDAGTTCTCGAGTTCKPAGTLCASSTECCSNNCLAGNCASAGAGCATYGETCAAAGTSNTCCSRWCQDVAGTDGGTDLRCVSSSSCRSRGEICSRNADCCSGVCSGGRCPTQAQLGQKLFVGEPCTQDSECASYACASTYPGGPKVCQFLGGCRPADEVCTADLECCGYLELSQTRDNCLTAQPTPGVCVSLVAVPGLRRCVLQPTDKEVGEICAAGGATVHSCCGGSAVCQPSYTGVSRCLGFATQADGGFQCLPNGTPCSIPEECCSRVCAQETVADGGTALVCSGCRAAGQACTANADCCAQICVGGLCVAVDGGTSCAPLGAVCTADAECCARICSGGVCRTCRTAGDLCAVNADCCGGACVPGDGGSLCGCLGNGTVCNQNSECCSNICSGSTCRTCRIDGDTCTANANCCSGICNLPDGGTTGSCAPIVN